MLRVKNNRFLILFQLNPFSRQVSHIKTSHCVVLLSVFSSRSVQYLKKLRAEHVHTLTQTPLTSWYSCDD